MSEPDSTHALDPLSWLQRHGDALFRFARARVGSRELAEDIVQDTLLAAIQSAHSFDGRSSELTWLTGILRHKTYDALRRRAREAAWQDSVRAELARDDTTSANHRADDPPWAGSPHPTAAERAEIVDAM